MDDQKKKAIAAAAKEVLKRPYNEITWREGTSGHSLKRWTLQDRISSSTDSFIDCGISFFVIWLLWVLWDPSPSVWPSLGWVLDATTVMTLIAFIHPGWGEFLVKLTGIKTTERNE